jgi:MiaB-like tRNA modifying enzyme
MTRRGGGPGRFALITLGCKVNQYESQALREAWLARGLDEAAKIGEADCIVINSCAVTARAVADLRAAVARARRAAPEARIVVTGCAAQVFGAELAALPGVTRVAPQRGKEVLLPDSGADLPPFPADSGRRAETSAIPPYPAFALSGYDRARAVVKVQDGCSRRCAYCIVPLARGKSRSRPAAETLAELRRLLAAGFREITLSGVNLAQYGRDMAEPHDFWDLVGLLERELAPEWTGLARLRMSSLEPGQLTEKALDTLGTSRLIAPHLHVSLQSGSADVLRRMGRGHYRADGLARFCERLAAVWPLFGLGADILAGFPGESEADARATEDICRALAFSYVHVFPYSRRPGTVAASLPGQIPQAVKKERAARLRAIADGKKELFLRRSLALPQVAVALESAEGGRGVNELYTDCEFVGPVAGAARSLVPAGPVGVRDGRLLVRAL